LRITPGTFKVYDEAPSAKTMNRKANDCTSASRTNRHVRVHGLPLGQVFKHFAFRIQTFRLPYPVWTCGQNCCRQLGHGDKVLKLVLTQMGCLARVWTCGQNCCRQLGHGDKVLKLVLTQMGCLAAHLPQMSRRVWVGVGVCVISKWKVFTVLTFSLQSIHALSNTASYNAHLGAAHRCSAGPPGAQL